MSRHLLVPMPGISEAFAETRLNDPISEVDVMKYQQDIRQTKVTLSPDTMLGLMVTTVV